MVEDKVNACTPLIGRTIERFETAEILHDHGTWDDWPDLPVRIYCDRDALLSVSWSRFDDLWLSNDTTLPFAAEGATTRWKSNGIESIRPAIGRSIRGVLLGRGEMSIDSRDIEIWTRLVFDLGDRWLEVFNALDENGYELHIVELNQQPARAGSQKDDLPLTQQRNRNDRSFWACSSVSSPGNTLPARGLPTFWPACS